MARRNGMPTMRKVALRLCLLITRFDVVIRKQFPENAALLAALDAAVVACAVLRQEIEAVLPIGV